MTKQNSGTIRIIAGLWRGRKIQFPLVRGLRPSSDRMRETLFNWLMPYIYGAKCLDLFAGSGALGLEALSRGAASVVAIDQTKSVVDSLSKNAAQLSADNYLIVQATWPQVPERIINSQYEVVFIDPPFHQDLVQPVCDWLIKQNCLANSAWIYIETERNGPLPEVPQSWQLFRHASTQQVMGLLYRSSKGVTP